MGLLKELIWLIVFLLVCAVCIIDFWVGGASKVVGTMSFSVLWFHIIIPIAAAFTAFMYGMKCSKAKWLYVVFCALMGILLAWVTFSLAGTLASGHWNMPSLRDAYVTAFPAFIGMFMSHTIVYSGKNL
jgi:hypothetical protein